MKNLVIIGGGTAGTTMANKLIKYLPANGWKIMIIERAKEHFYQPGFLFIPFGYYNRDQITKPTKKFFPKGIDVINNEVDRIEPDKNLVKLKNGNSITYDILLIATGTRITPEDTPGLKGDLWHKSVFDFYTLEGAEALAGFFKTWEGGNLVINIADNPIKCPVAPLEFSFYADEFFKKRGIRDKVKITYVTPMSGAFTKPKASKFLGSLMERKNINIVTDFFLGEVDNTNKKIIDFGGREVPFDCLVTIPLHSGDPVILKSGLGDEFGFVKANKNTLQSLKYQNIFVIGDASNLPTSKAGSVAHFQADILHENILSFINNEPVKASFDGHSNCYIETGYGKGILIDFNYETEPLPGMFPLPGIGPFTLLKESRINHWGKLFFKWMYWNLLLRGRWIPIPSRMSMKGKITD
jgi:sulfide:quinone oxidoreductase